MFTQASNDLSLPTKNSSHLSHISITEEDDFNTLINFDTSKAMGPDSIPPIRKWYDSNALKYKVSYLLRRLVLGLLVLRHLLA